MLVVECSPFSRMIERATGIILRTRPLTETSLIINWLTPEFGRLSTVAKGARRPKSPLRGMLDLFYEADFSFQRSRRSELHTLRDVSLRETHAPLRQELGWLQQASYGAALIGQTTEKETPLLAIFELMRELLAAIPKRPPQPQTIFAFELKLLDELGLKPDLDKSKLTPGAKLIVEKLALLDWPSLSRLKPSDAQSREIQQFLHGFLIFHLGKIPGGRTAALAL
jgi:DNA repair protein RecO (recombination protein O)